MLKHRPGLPGCSEKCQECEILGHHPTQARSFSPEEALTTRTPAGLRDPWTPIQWTNYFPEIGLPETERRGRVAWEMQATCRDSHSPREACSHWGQRAFLPDPSCNTRSRLP